MRYPVCLALLVLALQGTPAQAADGPAGPDLDHPAALEALHSDDVLLRRRALLALRESGAMDDVPEVMRALRDEDEVARAMAERTVWQIWSRSGDPATDDALARGTAMMGDGRVSESLDVFTGIVQAHPEFAEGWNKRATAYYMIGDYDRSRADCDEVLARNPLHFGALSGYGLIHMHQGRLAQSLDYFRRALELNPNMSSVDHAIRMIERALEREGRKRI